MYAHLFTQFQYKIPVKYIFRLAYFLAILPNVIFYGCLSLIQVHFRQYGKKRFYAEIHKIIAVCTISSKLLNH